MERTSGRVGAVDGTTLSQLPHNKFSIRHFRVFAAVSIPSFFPSATESEASVLEQLAEVAIGSPHKAQRAGKARNDTSPAQQSHSRKTRAGSTQTSARASSTLARDHAAGLNTGLQSSSVEVRRSPRLSSSEASRNDQDEQRRIECDSSSISGYPHDSGTDVRGIQQVQPSQEGVRARGSAKFPANGKVVGNYRTSRSKARKFVSHPDDSIRGKGPRSRGANGLREDVNPGEDEASDDSSGSDESDDDDDYVEEIPRRTRGLESKKHHASRVASFSAAARVEGASQPRRRPPRARILQASSSAVEQGRAVSSGQADLPAGTSPMFRTSARGRGFFFLPS